MLFTFGFENYKNGNEKGMYKKFSRAFGAVTADSAPAIRFCPSNPPILPDSAVLLFAAKTAYSARGRGRRMRRTVGLTVSDGCYDVLFFLCRRTF